MAVDEMPQHLSALARANEVRLARAEIKREIAEGRRSVASVITECPWAVETMTIADALMAQHRWGTTRVRKLLQSIPMSENRTLGQMTQRQRRSLVKLLGEYAAAEPSVAA